MKISEEVTKKIFNLRRSGHSIPEISNELKLSKSTVLRYTRNVEIEPENLQRWLDRRNASKIISERQKSIAVTKAEGAISRLDDTSLMLIASSLYWAEGNKKDFCFTNTDAEMVRIFVYILRRVFSVKDEDFKISIRIYEDLNKEECIIFWSKILNLNLENNVSINVLKGKKTGKLKHGMCRVRVKKAGLLLKTIFAINKRVGELITPRSSTDRAAAS